MLVSYTSFSALGTNTSNLRVSYLNFPDADAIFFDIELIVDCPTMHTSISSPLNTTFVEIPTIYYDISQNSPMTVPMNYWQINPQDNFEDIVCFTATKHGFIDATTGVALTFITVLNFEEGLIEIDQTDASYTG